MHVHMHLAVSLIGCYLQTMKPNKANQSVPVTLYQGLFINPDNSNMQVKLSKYSACKALMAAWSDHM